MAIEVRPSDPSAAMWAQAATGVAEGARSLDQSNVAWERLGLARAQQQQQQGQFEAAFGQRERQFGQELEQRSALQTHRIEAQQQLQQAGFDNDVERMELELNAQQVLETYRSAPGELQAAERLKQQRFMVQQEVMAGRMTPRRAQAQLATIDAYLRPLQAQMFVYGALEDSWKRRQQAQQRRQQIQTQTLDSGSNLITIFNPDGTVRQSLLDDSAVRAEAERRRAEQAFRNQVVLQQMNQRDGAGNPVPLSLRDLQRRTDIAAIGAGFGAGEQSQQPGAASPQQPSANAFVPLVGAASAGGQRQADYGDSIQQARQQLESADLTPQSRSTISQWIEEASLHQHNPQRFRDPGPLDLFTPQDVQTLQQGASATRSAPVGEGLGAAIAPTVGGRDPTLSESAFSPRPAGQDPSTRAIEAPGFGAGWLYPNQWRLIRIDQHGRRIVQGTVNSREEANTWLQQGGPPYQIYTPD